MNQLSQRLGFCIICGDRVFTAEKYLKASEGYCHQHCLTDTAVLG